MANLDLGLLRTLAAVVRTGGFRGAADETASAPSTVQKQMRSLEADLDIKLFERTGRAISITNDARLLVAASHELLESADVLRNRIEQIRVSSEQTLRLACAPIHLARFLSPVLRIYEREHPNVTCDLTVFSPDDLRTSQEFDSLLASGKCDIVATTQNLQGRDSLPMWKTHLIAVMADDHPLRHRRTITVSDLEEELVLAAAPHLWSRRELDRLTTSAGARLQVVTESLPEVAVGTAQSGLAIAVMADDSLPSLASDLPRITDNKHSISTVARLHWRKDHETEPMRLLLDIVKRRTRGRLQA